MLTSALVTRILNETGAGWTRAQALEILNLVQNEVLATDNDLMRIKPDPYFTTTNATYSYTARTQTGSLYDIRNVAEIYSLEDRDSLTALSLLNTDSSRPYKWKRTRDGIITYARFDCVISTRAAADSSDSTYDCVVKWWTENNPGTTTTTWRARAYRWPNQLTAESIQLETPAEFHDTVLLPGVLMRTERREYGRGDSQFPMYEKYLNKLKHKYLYAANTARESHVYPEIC